jgi:hypothetical protein
MALKSPISTRFVILSPFASLRVNSAKNLTQGVILNAVKDLMSSFAWLRAGSVKNLIKSGS